MSKTMQAPAWLPRAAGRQQCRHRDGTAWARPVAVGGNTGTNHLAVSKAAYHGADTVPNEYALRRDPKGDLLTTVPIRKLPEALRAAATSAVVERALSAAL